MGEFSHVQCHGSVTSLPLQLQACIDTRSSPVTSGLDSLVMSVRCRLAFQCEYNVYVFAQVVVCVVRYCAAYADTFETPIALCYSSQDSFFLIRSLVSFLVV